MDVASTDSFEWVEVVQQHLHKVTLTHSRCCSLTVYSSLTVTVSSLVVKELPTESETAFFSSLLFYRNR